MVGLGWLCPALLALCWHLPGRSVFLSPTTRVCLASIGDGFSAAKRWDSWRGGARDSACLVRAFSHVRGLGRGFCSFSSSASHWAFRAERSGEIPHDRKLGCPDFECTAVARFHLLSAAEETRCNSIALGSSGESPEPLPHLHSLRRWRLQAKKRSSPGCFRS